MSLNADVSRAALRKDYDETLALDVIDMPTLQKILQWKLETLLNVYLGENGMWDKMTPQLASVLKPICTKDASGRWSEQWQSEVDEARQPVLIISGPGLGKTAILSGLARQMQDIVDKLGINEKVGFFMISAGTKLQGSWDTMPISSRDKDGNGYIEEYFSRGLLPQEDTNGKLGILLLDELTTATVDQVLPILKLTDDTRSLGRHYTLPRYWIVVGAGNGPKDNNFVSVSKAELTRFDGYFVKPSTNEVLDWLNNYGVKQADFHDLITAYLTLHPEDAVRDNLNDDSVEQGKDRREVNYRVWTHLNNTLHSIEHRFMGEGKEHYRVIENMDNPVVRHKILGSLGEDVGAPFMGYLDSLVQVGITELDIVNDWQSSYTNSKRTSGGLPEGAFIYLNKSILRYINNELRATQERSKDDPNHFNKCKRYYENAFRWGMAWTGSSLNATALRFLKTLASISTASNAPKYNIPAAQLQSLTTPLIQDKTMIDFTSKWTKGIGAMSASSYNEYTAELMEGGNE